jgi:hypothetical protein
MPSSHRTQGGMPSGIFRSANTSAAWTAPSTVIPGLLIPQCPHGVAPVSPLGIGRGIPREWTRRRIVQRASVLLPRAKHTCIYSTYDRESQMLRMEPTEESTDGSTGTREDCAGPVKPRQNRQGPLCGTFSQSGLHENAGECWGGHGEVLPRCFRKQYWPHSYTSRIC